MDYMLCITVRTVFIKSEKPVQIWFYSKQISEVIPTSTLFLFYHNCAFIECHGMGAFLSKWNIPGEMCNYQSEKLGFWIQTDLDLCVSDLGQVT